MRGWGSGGGDDFGRRCVVGGNVLHRKPWTLREQIDGERVACQGVEGSGLFDSGSMCYFPAARNACGTACRYLITGHTEADIQSKWGGASKGHSD